jgi:nitrate reductase NapE
MSTQTPPEGNMAKTESRQETGSSKRREWTALLFIVAIVVPLLSIAVVGGYGFVVWMLQVFVLGPPGHGG